VPIVRSESVSVALPEPSSAAAGCVAPSMVNTTLPVGVPVPLVGATVAVKVTASPSSLGLSDD
jgi:hypothetical protein